MFFSKNYDYQIMLILTLYKLMKVVIYNVKKNIYRHFLFAVHITIILFLFFII